jgi:cytochrome P450
MLRMLQRVVATPRLIRTCATISPSFRLWHPAVRRDPYPTYRRFRAARMTRLRLFGGWMAARYADVERILREPAFSTDRRAVPAMAMLHREARGAPAFEAFLEHNLLMVDGTRHRRLRALVAKAFTPRRVEALRMRAESLVDGLLDRVAARGEMDVVRELAEPFPTIMIAELLGVPAADHARFRAWSDGLVDFLDPLSGTNGLARCRAATAELAAYFRELLAERRRAPRDDLLSAMLTAENDGSSLTEDELVALASLLLAAGNETTTSLIGNAVVLLLRHPSERRRLQDDLGLVASAVEECLRVEPPVQLTDRAVVEPAELAGIPLAPGTIVGALLAAANRDPERFPDPDRFDVGRADNLHLSFGYGNHFCLGAALARLETQVALSALLRRFPDFTGTAEPPDWKRSIVLRGPTALPIRLRSRRGHDGAGPAAAGG